MIEETSAGATVVPATVPRGEWEPAYLRLERTGELEARARALHEIYRACRLCPRRCSFNRLEGRKGVCRSVAHAKVYGAHPHFGEERPLVGRNGSGTIFFSDCSLRCVFCQNWEAALRRDCDTVTDLELARMMIGLERRGCHNINLVTPTHYVPNIVAALRFAIDMGLRIPLVYNSCGYESVEIIRMLDGIVDIYLPDFKYTDSAAAARYSSGAKDYPQVTAAAIEEMHRQVGDLVVDEDGIALRGLIIRHLVMPNNVAGTDEFVRWVAERLTRSTYVNIMPQYQPAFRASEFPEIARRITATEYRRAIGWARQAGLTRLGED